MSILRQTFLDLVESTICFAGLFLFLFAEFSALIPLHLSCTEYCTSLSQNKCWTSQVNVEFR